MTTHDPQQLEHDLRKARRLNNLDEVLAACEGLLEIDAYRRAECEGVCARWCPCCGTCSCPEYGSDLNTPTCALHSLTSPHTGLHAYIPSIRAAAIWALGSVNHKPTGFRFIKAANGVDVSTATCIPCARRWSRGPISGQAELPGEGAIRLGAGAILLEDGAILLEEGATLMEDIRTWHVINLDIIHYATRIANLARMLPDPQPVTSETSHIVPKDHALRIYIDALMVVKGDLRMEWWDWFASWAIREGGWSHPRTPHIMEYRDAAVFCDGNVMGGEHLPPLPILEQEK